MDGIGRGNCHRGTVYRAGNAKEKRWLFLLRQCECTNYETPLTLDLREPREQSFVYSPSIRNVGRLPARSISY